jgi:hypothetical protein
MLTARGLLVAIGFVLFGTTVSWAQTGNQTFDVTVPSTLSIAAPSATVVLTHNKANANQTFPTQAWNVVGNPPAGVAVTISTSTPFVHTTQATFKADARLALTLGATTGSTYAITTATDTTNFVGNDNTASVAVSSNGPGTARLNVVVSFVSNNFSVLAAGTYRTVITGTIAAN